MKKVKVKTIVKLARKQIRKSLKLNLMKQIEDLTGKFGQGSDRLSKVIGKSSDRIAKKLSKVIKIDKSIISEVINEPEVFVSSNNAHNADDKKPINSTKTEEIAIRKPRTRTFNKEIVKQ